MSERESFTDVNGTRSLLPLTDIRVLALEQYGAGPFGSVHLAELGAEIIKIEDHKSGGDVGRSVPPHNGAGSSFFFETFNHNKLSVGLDLRTSAGREVFQRLVARSDVVYSNFRGDVPGKLRITYDDLRSFNPLIVCCSLSAFGMTGSHAGEPGYDYIFQGLAGWMSLTGEPDSPPTKTGLSLVDFAAGYVAALGILAAVHAARRDGHGFDCDLALYDVAMNLLTYVATWQLSSAITTTRIPSSAHPTLVPFQNFQTSDGWIVVACAKEKFWSRLVEAIDAPSLGSDPRFVDFEARAKHRDDLVPLLTKVFLGDTQHSWVERLRAAGVPVAPVHDLPASLSDPLVAERNLVNGYDADGLGPVRLIRSPVDVGGLRQEPTPAPSLGENSRQVLMDLAALTQEEIDVLERDGVIPPSI